MFHLLISLFLINQSFADLSFQKACDRGETLTIGAVGDVLLHQPLQVQGYKDGFQTLWTGLLPYMEAPDLMYANLEGPAAAGIQKNGKEAKKDPGQVFDGNVYSGYPLFNYNPIIAQALKDSGVDIVSTANNHAMDRKSIGVRKTIEALDKYDLPYVGTRSDSKGVFYRIMEKKGWRLGWIACSFSTNDIGDPEDLVLDCYDGRVSEIIKEIQDQVDAVIVTPHWGNEYANSPTKQRINLGYVWLEDGATAVLGSHPHVTQPWDKYTTSDGREGLVVYSLGNFVSNQTPVVKQSSLMVFLGLSKSEGKVWINGVRYLPLYMQRKPYEVVASNFVEDPSKEVKQSLQLMTNMFGTDRVLGQDEEIVTNPECH